MQKIIAMQDIIRQTLDEHGRLTRTAASSSSDSDLFAVGLTSFAAVQLMLAIEERFDVEFPDRMINRRSWASIDMIVSCLTELKPQEVAV